MSREIVVKTSGILFHNNTSTNLSSFIATKLGSFPLCDLFLLVPFISQILSLLPSIIFFFKNLKTCMLSRNSLYYISGFSVSVFPFQSLTHHLIFFYHSSNVEITLAANPIAVVFHSFHFIFSFLLSLMSLILVHVS